MPRIAIVAAQNMGKSTLIEEFCKKFPQYTKSNGSYREAIKEKGLGINKEGNELSQSIILDCLIDEVMKYSSTDKVIHDRCPLDNLVYTLYLKEYFPDRISDEFVKKSFALVKESLKFIDVIFYIPILKKYPPPKMEERESRSNDELYRLEIDNIFKVIHQTYVNNVPWVFPFDTKDGSPPVIEIFGELSERIQMIKLYIDPETGDLYGDNKSTMNDIITPEDARILDELLKQNSEGAKIITDKSIKNNK